MQLPFFFLENFDEHSDRQVLSDDSSRHILQVLRMKQGESLHLTDGKGLLITGVLSGVEKKKAVVEVQHIEKVPPNIRQVYMGVSLLKNATRFEWFLEKAGELGVDGVIPLICERTERRQFRMDRARQILISAILQSQKCYLPELMEPVQFDQLMHTAYLSRYDKKWIAHCAEDEKISIRDMNDETYYNGLILIGPEGDFSEREIQLAKNTGFVAVSVGEERLRTETAAVAAAAFLIIWSSA